MGYCDRKSKTPRAIIKSLEFTEYNEFTNETEAMKFYYEINDSLPEMADKEEGNLKPREEGFELAATMN